MNDSEFLSIDGLHAKATSLGVTNVAEFVQTQQNIYREERAAAREIIRQELHLKELEIECRDHAAQRAHELELARLNVSAEADNTREIRNSHYLSSIQPKLPSYRDGDDLSSYLDRFERIATLLEIPIENWAVHLGSLLSGKALDVYTCASEQDTSTYGGLKEVLLTGFHKTTDSYRLDFRSLKLSPNQTYHQFATQLKRALNRWLESAKVDRDFDSILEFFLRDQFLSSVPNDLRVFLKEQKVETLPKLIELSDSWSQAHKSYPKSSFVRRDRVTAPIKSFERESYNRNVGAIKKDFSKIMCHYCKEFGHMQSRCPIRKGIPVVKDHVQFVFSDETRRKYLAQGTVNGQNVSTIWRDTGCSSVMVSDELMPNLDVRNCKKVSVADFVGNVHYLPECRVYIKCPFYEGWVNALRAQLKMATR